MKSPGVQNKFRPSIIFRLADLYLLYAEAVNEIDPQDERVLTYLNKVRQRAGLSNIEELNPAIEGNQECKDSQFNVKDASNWQRKDNVISMFAVG